MPGLPLRLLDRARRLLALGLVAAVAVTAGACSGKTESTGETGAGAASSRSSGCDKPPSPGSRTVSLRHDGIDRTYDIVVPDAKPGEPMAVVLGFHGFGGSAPEQARVSRLGEHARAEGFVAVFPQGSDAGGTSPAYHNLETVDEPSLADDVGFTAALLDDVEADVCVDRTRVFAMGLSNGGMFVSTLACMLGDRIAAVAPVAGVHLLPDCGGRPVPIVVTHGTADPLVPFDDGTGGLVALADLIGLEGEIAQQLRMFEAVVDTPASSWVESWAKHNGCSLDAPEVTDLGSGVERVTYTGCDAGGDVVLQEIEGGGHEWPTAPELDTTAEALEFFRDHPLPAEAPES